MFSRLFPRMGRSLVASAAMLLLIAPLATAKADPAALKRLVADAGKASSQRLIIWQHGKPVLDKRWSGNNEALHPVMHITAAISALAVTCLVADGKIPSLDAPAVTYFPEWKGTPKARITVRHILQGRTGLMDDGRIGALYARPNMVTHLATRSLGNGVGQNYDHDSAVLIARVVQKAAGEPIDKYLARRLFAPLGITQTRWRRDKAGNIDTGTGLWLKPTDLVRIGELVRLNGRWNGRGLIPTGLLGAATTAAGDRGGKLASGYPGDAYGFYWNVGQRVVLQQQDLARLKAKGFPNAAKLAPLVGKGFPGTQYFIHDAAARLGANGYRHLNDARTRYGGEAYSILIGRANGLEAGDFLGQALYVNPTTQVVMVRTVPWNGAAVTRSYAKFEFDDLGDRVNKVFGGR